VPFIDRCREFPYQGKAIGPRGNDASRIILVGEAPGATEID
jgi:uracil-DNA glycosylase